MKKYLVTIENQSPNNPKLTIGYKTSTAITIDSSYLPISVRTYQYET